MADQNHLIRVQRVGHGDDVGAEPLDRPATIRRATRKTVAAQIERRQTDATVQRRHLLAPETLIAAPAMNKQHKRISSLENRIGDRFATTGGGSGDH